MMEEGYYVIT